MTLKQSSMGNSYQGFTGWQNLCTWVFTLTSTTLSPEKKMQTGFSLIFEVEGYPMWIDAVIIQFWSSKEARYSLWSKRVQHMGPCFWYKPWQSGWFFRRGKGGLTEQEQLKRKSVKAEMRTKNKLSPHLRSRNQTGGYFGAHGSIDTNTLHNTKSYRPDSVMFNW